MDRQTAQGALGTFIAVKFGVEAHGTCGGAPQAPGVLQLYQASHRRHVEERFGWLKTIGGLRRTRYRGRVGTELYG